MQIYKKKFLVFIFHKLKRTDSVFSLFPHSILCMRIYFLFREGKKKSTSKKARQEQDKGQKTLRVFFLDTLNVPLFIRMTRWVTPSLFYAAVVVSQHLFLDEKEISVQVNTMRSDVLIGWNSCARCSRLSHAIQLVFTLKLLIIDIVRKQLCTNPDVDCDLWWTSQKQYGAPNLKSSLTCIF